MSPALVLTMISRKHLGQKNMVDDTRRKETERMQAFRNSAIRISHLF